MAQIIIPTPLRKFTNNQAKIDSNKNTVQAAIEDLAKQYPNFQKHLLDEAGQIHPFIKIFVGEDDILDLDKEQTTLENNTIVSIIPAIAGGSYNYYNLLK
ncbi:MAG: MoaD/ThiS family protein [Aureispira sp.]|nr:MoaD/ThiS family protein [Aureispira sp.]